MSKYNVGDIVTTNLSHSKWNTPIPPGPKRVSQAYLLDGEVSLEVIPEDPNENYVVNAADVQPYAPTFKRGDLVEVLLDCEDPFFHGRLQAGTKGAVHGHGIGRNDGLVFISTTEYGGTHNGYFSAKTQHLRLVTTYDLKTGDWVTTDQTTSHYGSKVPPGPLYVHQVHPAVSDYLNDPERAHVGSGPTKMSGDVVIATRFLTPIVMHSVSLAKPEQRDEPKTKAGTGWTFRIPADEPIDGKRVLKELADAGADYAVVAWGKRDDQRLCLVSQQLAERALAAGVDESLTRAVVTNFHQAFTSTTNASSLAGTSNYCYVNATTLAELEDYAKRVKDAERRARPTTVRVNFGVAK